MSLKPSIWLLFFLGLWLQAGEVSGQSSSTKPGDKRAELLPKGCLARIGPGSTHKPGPSPQLFFTSVGAVQTFSDSDGLQTWDARSGEWLGRVDIGKGLQLVCQSPDRRYYVFFQGAEEARPGVGGAKDAGYVVMSGKDGKTKMTFEEPSGFDRIWFTGNAQVMHVSDPAEYEKPNTRRYDMRTNKWLPDISFPGSYRIRAIAPNGRWVVLRDSDQWAVVDSESRKTAYRIPRPVSPGLQNLGAVHFSPDSRLLLVLDLSLVDRIPLAVYEASTGKKLHDYSLSEKHQLPAWKGDIADSVRSWRAESIPFAVAPDNRHVIIQGAEGMAVWGLPDARRLMIFKEPRRIAEAAFSPDGRVVATARDDGVVTLWDFVDLPRRDVERVELTRSRWDRYWEALGCGNAAWSDEAMAALERDAKQTVAGIKARLQPIPKVSAAQVEGWLDDLANPRFGIRDDARKGLEAQQELILDALDARLSTASMPLETRRRLEELRAKVAGPHTTQKRSRQWLALELLERIGSSEARAALDGLAGGCRDARLTLGARMRLSRLGAGKEHGE